MDYEIKAYLFFLLSAVQFTSQKRNQKWIGRQIQPISYAKNLLNFGYYVLTLWHRILVNYMASIDTDITEDLSPPRSLYVDVRYDHIGE